MRIPLEQWAQQFGLAQVGVVELGWMVRIEPAAELLPC